jgi:hypothetical protein
MHLLQTVYVRFRQHREAADKTQGKEAILKWTTKAEVAFQTLKGALCTAPTFAYLQP